MAYVPDQGDICWITLNPQSGHEQSGRRPALVVSNKEFNMKTPFAVVCPISNTDNGFPMHVKLSGGTTTGVVMVEHMKTQDYRARNSEFIEKVDEEIMVEVLSKLHACF